MSPAAMDPIKRSFSVTLTSATPLEVVLIRHLDALPRSEQARRLLALAAQGYLIECRLLRICDAQPKRVSVGGPNVMPGFQLGAARALNVDTPRSTGNLRSEPATVSVASSDPKPFAFLRSVMGS